MSTQPITGIRKALEVLRNSEGREGWAIDEAVRILTDIEIPPDAQ